MSPSLGRASLGLATALVLFPLAVDDSSHTSFGSQTTASLPAAASAAPRSGKPTSQRIEALPPEALAKLKALAHHAREQGERIRASKRARKPASRARIDALRSAGVIEPRRGELSVAGVEHQPYVLQKRGLPFFNRQGRLHSRAGKLAGHTGDLSFPPLADDPSWIGAPQALAIANAHSGVTQLRAQPRLERGWLAEKGASIPAWRVQIPAREPFGTWQVLLDGRDGSVLSSVDLIRNVEGLGRVYDPNPVSNPTPALVPLHDLDGSGQLFGSTTRVIDDRAPGAFRPDSLFDFPTTDSRFIQTNVYRGLTDTARYAVSHGFPSFPEPVLAFANIGDGMGGEFNNAFYDPFFPLFGFGNGDGVLTANLGVDLDVAAHEMGHHLFEVLVQPLIFTGTEPAAAMTEGVADTFAALIGGDPDVGESTLPGQPFLRSVDNTLIFPDDVSADPHLTGLIYAGANWDLIEDLGAENFADTLLAGLPFLPSSPSAPDYRDAIVQGDQVLTGGLNAATIQSAFADRGFSSQEDPPDFKGFLADGVTTDQAPAGDADLVVGPISTLNLSDPSTYLFSENFFTSNEFVQVDTGTSPSVTDDDLWVVFVFDFADGDPSGYSLNALGQLPVLSLSIDGAPLVESLSFQGEIDVAAFQGTAGQVVRLEAESLSPTLDPLVFIVDPDDFSVLGADDDSGPGTDALIQGALLPQTKTYTVVTLSPTADVDPNVGTGDYRLTLTACNNTGTDTDGDGQVDACDDDDDDDGIRDAFDLAPTDELSCSDVDGDACDDCSGGSGPDILADGTDTDFDSLCDAGDLDDDNDGCQDPVDASPLAPSADPDLDFLGDDCDNCPALSNPAQTDTDTDGSGDACDLDDDGDGLDDTVETDTGSYVSPSDTGTDPLLADSDGDGFDDGIEVAAGSDPNSAASVPEAAALPSLGPLGLALLGAALAAAGAACGSRRRGSA